MQREPPTEKEKRWKTGEECERRCKLKIIKGNKNTRWQTPMHPPSKKLTSLSVQLRLSGESRVEGLVLTNVSANIAAAIFKGPSWTLSYCRDNLRTRIWLSFTAQIPYLFHSSPSAQSSIFLFLFYLITLSFFLFYSLLPTYFPFW